MNKKVVAASVAIVSIVLLAIGLGNFNLSGKAINKNNDTIVSFSTLMQGKNSQVNYNKTEVVRNSSDWSNLWGEIYPSSLVSPSINFSKVTILGIFGGNEPNWGYGAYIFQINKYEDRVDVIVKQEISGSNCPTLPGTIQPYQVVVLDRIEQPVEFVFDKKIYNC